MGVVPMGFMSRGFCSGMEAEGGAPRRVRRISFGVRRRAATTAGGAAPADDEELSRSTAFARRAAAPNEG